MSNSRKNKILAEKTRSNKEKNNGLEALLTSQSYRNSAFQVANIEHTLLDVELVNSKNKTRLGRPWLTLLIDEFKGSVLG